MTLDGLETIGDIERFDCDREEINGLLKKAERKLADSRFEKNSEGTRFELAYTVILTCATIALRASNFRIKKKSGHHFISIETLRHTMCLDKKTVDYFQTMRELRHRDIYAPDLLIMKSDLDEAINEAEKLVTRTTEWLRENNP